MIDAMNQFKLPKYQAFKNPALAQPGIQPPANTPVTFGQKTTQPLHAKNGHQGDVFIKSAPTANTANPASAIPAKPASTSGSSLANSLQSWAQQRIQGSNPWLNALKKLSPLAETAASAANKLWNPAINANNPNQANRNKVTLFAGAALTAGGLGALSGLVLGPAALAANPTLLNKVVSLLPTQLP